jgi:hypothetical protein
VEVGEELVMTVFFGLLVTVVWVATWRSFLVANPTLNVTVPFAALVAPNCLKEVKIKKPSGHHTTDKSGM